MLSIEFNRFVLIRYQHSKSVINSILFSHFFFRQKENFFKYSMPETHKNACYLKELRKILDIVFREKLYYQKNVFKHLVSWRKMKVKKRWDSKWIEIECKNAGSTTHLSDHRPSFKLLLFELSHKPLTLRKNAIGRATCLQSSDIHVAFCTARNRSTAIRYGHVAQNDEHLLPRRASNSSSHVFAFCPAFFGCLELRKRTFKSRTIKLADNAKANF